MLKQFIQRARSFFGSTPEGESGQAMVEFAIAFPLQLFLTFGIMQLILIYIASLMVNFAAYRACRAAVVTEDAKAHEAAKMAARVVLAPLTGRSYPAGLVNSHDEVNLPGWGDLNRSDYAYGKVHVFVGNVENWDITQTFSDDTFTDERTGSGTAGVDDPKDVTVVVEFDYELIFPVIDALFATFFADDEYNPEEETVFGIKDAGYTESSGSRQFDSLYVPGKGIDSSAGRVREIGGAYHYVIGRECTMYREHEITLPD